MVSERLAVGLRRRSRVGAQHLLWLVELLSIVPSRRERFKLPVLWCAMLLAQTGRIRRSFSATLTWQGPRGPLSASVSDLSQLRTIRDIYVHDAYAVPDGVQPRTIVDLGSHAGLSVLYFSALFPSARIVAVEPHPDTFDLLRRNTARLDGVELLNAAVSDRSGQLPLYSGAASWSASLTAHPDAPSARHVVPALTLDELAQRFGLHWIDVLKVDIEGSEVPVLRSSPAALRTTAAIILEYHQEHDAGTLWSLLEDLEDFRPARVTGRSDGHALVTLVRRP